MGGLIGAIIDWQLWAALLLVAASISLLANRVGQLFRRRDCGGGCAGCAANTPVHGTRQQPFVGLEQIEGSAASQKSLGS